MMELPYVSIVVIGFNEAVNLDNTFKAISNINYPKEKFEVIYVDSGSVDSSVQVARKYCSKIFIENRFPSPGRNRNRGLTEAQYNIVHFIDGDVTIDKDYLRNITNLFEDKNAHAIVGELDEQRPNIYNKLAALSNSEKTEGYTNATSTGATYLKKTLLSVNGYDERIRRGQESELGERFRKAGYKIWCTKYKMGSHNFGVDSLWDYLKKYEINARSMLQLAFFKGDSEYIKSAKRKILKQIIKLIGFLVIVSLSIIFHNILILLAFLLLAWFLRVKDLFKKKFKEKPFAVSIRMLIDFFFFWKWWVGFFKELFNYIFDEESKQFYNLEKMQLKK